MHLVRSIFFKVALITLLLTPYLVCRSPGLAISHQQQTRTQPLSRPPVGIDPLADCLAFLQSQAIADTTRAPTRLAFGDTLASVPPEDGKVSRPLRPHYTALPPSWLTKTSTRP